MRGVAVAPQLDVHQQQPVASVSQSWACRWRATARASYRGDGMGCDSSSSSSLNSDA
jgi:hypothetical protein